MEQSLRSLPAVLLPWYRADHRQLPWREDREPYHVWLSEIMLQQTRVEAVRGYYARFLAALPSIAALADVQDALLLKLWEGLGYYSRARNMKKAAQIIVQRYGGVFPCSYDTIRALPGIGDYTAGAICSICFDMPTAAVDGNVLRVYARLTADRTPVEQPKFRKTVARQLEAVYPTEAGLFTQALMELGATVCLPNGRPNCAQCPCSGFCAALSEGIQRELPVRSPKRARKTAYKTIFILSCRGCYALVKRGENGLLAGLWQFPEAEGILEPAQALAAARDMGLRVCDIRRQTDRKHIFTHIEWQMRGYYLEVEDTNDTFSWQTAEQIRREAALPTAFRQFFDV